MKAFILSLLALVALAPPQRTIDDFYNDVTARWVRYNPNFAVSSRYFTGDEQDRLEQQLTPETTEWKKGRIQLAREGLAELRQFERSKMTPGQRTSAELLQWQLETTVQGEPYLDYVFPLEQFGGANVNLPNALTITHPLRTEKDAEHYVARLGQVRERMNEAIAEARRLSDQGMIPPRFIIQATITQMQQFVGSAPKDNPFVATFAERMSSISSIPAARREQLRAEAEKIVSADVYPAWTRGIDLLKSILPKANDDAGLWRFKGGPQAYAYFLKQFTSTSLTPDQIHEMGLQQVARIEKQMDEILRKLGRTEGSVKDRVAKLKQDLAYPNTEEGRKLIMADVEQYLRDAERRSKLLFDRTPKAPVIAQPFPRFREANAAANYTAPPQDGSRPGIFQIPLRKERMTKFGLRSLVYHETVPGHHFQIALQVENPKQPRWRQVRAFGGISGFSEGWGLYAEHLASESGWYEGDLEGLVGQLDSELFRARRMVVDTGIHAKHWTRQQAIDYGIEASEVERYVVYAGQAPSYMLGELKIIEVREDAKKKLGSRFALKEFHNAVFDTGMIPLDLMPRQIQAALYY
jgi:uncharacterized protein (DUF885 family)